MPAVLPHNQLAATLESPAYTAIVPVVDYLSDDLLADVHRHADAVELRVDRLLPCSDTELIDHCGRFGRTALLATIRDQSEGGRWVGSAPERLSLIELLLPYVHGVDMELDSACLPEAVRLAEGKVLIASSHHFSGDIPLSFPQLVYRFHRAMDAGADYFKVATVCNDEDALAQLTGFMELYAGEPIIAVAMGKYGVEGRKRLLELGSRATFAYAGATPVVPGQLSLAEFCEFADR